MRKFIATVIAGLMFCLGVAAIPAEATAPTTVSTPTSAEAWEWGKPTPAAMLTPGNGFAMGVLPNYWTLCVANGYGPTVGGPVLSWNYPGRALTISLRNVCTGYSITNRMTIDNVNNAGACIQYSNLGHTATQQQHWGPYYWIWNQNPVIWINTRSGCNNAGGQLEHNAAKGVGYILGLAYGTCSDCVMGPDNNFVTRATNADSLDANVIYQMP